MLIQVCHRLVQAHYHAGVRTRVGCRVLAVATAQPVATFQDAAAGAAFQGVIAAAAHQRVPGVQSEKLVVLSVSGDHVFMRRAHHIFDVTEHISSGIAPPAGSLRQVHPDPLR